MLIKCPECELQVSDKANDCPHCGYPLKEKPKHKYKPKRMRLPNGFGQISEIKGQNLRNPFRAMVTVGTNVNGHPISKLLKPQSYFKTYNEAYQALIEYNKNPYDLDQAITIGELYEKWTASYFDTLESDASKRTIRAAWAYCHAVENIRAKDLKIGHIKDCMENGIAVINGAEKKPSAGTKGRIKSLFNLMLDYGMEWGVVDRNVSRMFNLSEDIIIEQEKACRGHIVFTDEEMQKIKDAVNIEPYADIILVQCYMGWRPQELGLLERANVDLTNWNIIGGMKTENGRNRTVPIHSSIRNIISDWYSRSEGSKYLFSCSDAVTHRLSTTLTYDKYAQRFKKVIEKLGLNPEHRPHDPRKQFVSMAKKYKVDEYAIKRIVGHRISDITEAIYTERDPHWLNEEIEKIK